MNVGRIGVAVVLVVASATLAATAAPGIGPEGRASPATPADGSELQVDTDRVRLVVAVDARGDARWTVEYRTDLDDENTTAAFDSLQADIESNPDAYTDRFADRIRATVRDAENATGREMTASNFSVTAETDVANDQGVVRYTYRWSNFAQADDEQIVVGDAIAGFFLGSRTSLSVQWPDDYALSGASPEPTSVAGRSLVWRGTSVDFGPDQPRVTLTRERATPTQTATTTETVRTATPTETATGGDGGATPTTTTNETAGAGGDGGGFPAWVLVVLLVVVLGVGAAWWQGPFGDGDGTAGTGAGSESGEGGASAGATAAAGSDGDTESEESEPESTDESEPAIDEELLSNEERVLRLLEDHGGRMKQQEVVEELGWTEAKTSQVVSGMREEDEVETFRLGRENVLTLPGTEIDPNEEDS